ncbi:DUF6843 domain-containing protein [Acidicapsa ligni]|uniref:DUF6843 domain-containing protein n=1 Tax=Acidicapsa ligni TaxID=542300 RepID=UPI0021E07E48|nr:hypothetical protein [Acidicapsa ligni]
MTPTKEWRYYVTSLALACAMAAVASLLALHLSWVSPDVSQRLGTNGIRVFGLLLFWPTILGLVVSGFGVGPIRILSIVTCLVAGLWYFTLVTTAAISMGASTVRHPSRFLIPKGYVGWITIKHGREGAPSAFSNGKYVYQIPVSGIFETSSAVEDGWAHDEYFYYTKNGPLEEVPSTGWGQGGLIWGETVGVTTPGESRPKQMSEKFYVGTEEQFRANESHAISVSQ